MSQLRPGLPPERVSGALPRPAALLTSLVCVLLAACSTTGKTVQPVSYYRAPVPGVGAPLRADAPPVEIEDDGIEAQLPPRRRVHQIPDDPTQPYSRNYGSVPPMQDEDYTPGSSWETIVTRESVG